MWQFTLATLFFYQKKKKKKDNTPHHNILYHKKQDKKRLDFFIFLCYNSGGWRDGSKTRTFVRANANFNAPGRVMGAGATQRRRACRK